MRVRTRSKAGFATFLLIPLNNYALTFTEPLNLKLFSLAEEASPGQVHEGGSPLPLQETEQERG